MWRFSASATFSALLAVSWCAQHTHCFSSFLVSFHSFSSLRASLFTQLCTLSTASCGKRCSPALFILAKATHSLCFLCQRVSCCLPTCALLFVFLLTASLRIRSPSTQELDLAELCRDHVAAVSEALPYGQRPSRDLHHALLERLTGAHRLATAAGEAASACVAASADCLRKTLFMPFFLTAAAAASRLAHTLAFVAHAADLAYRCVRRGLLPVECEVSISRGNGKREW